MRRDTALRLQGVVLGMLIGPFVVAAILAGRCGAAPPDAAGPAAGAASQFDLARSRPAAAQGSVSALWPCDKRWKGTPELKGRTSVTIADLKGPAVITMLRISKVASRGVILEISFDGEAEPAVRCPLPDFFGDGCNSRSMDFSTRFIEVVPAAYNCYFPMPFKTSAKVALRNETGADHGAYSVVEWQALPAWDPQLNYFHATWQRRGFVLTDKTRQEFFRVAGRGHLVGRQFSIATDDPSFSRFGFVMEGNNVVDIDGRERVFDYLGSEDSFTFSWGFQKPFIGRRAGMTHLEMQGSRSRLSIYRFHDHMPIRFEKELAWSIDWSDETCGRQNGWVDYATVFYWYQDAPAGYRHAPLPPAAERMRDILPRPEILPDLKAILDAMPVDPDPANAFSTAKDLDRVRILQAYPKTHPFWIDEPQAKGGHPGNPNPGRRGILAVHAEEVDRPCLILRKVALAADKPAVLRLVVSGDPYEGPGKSDFLLDVGVYDGREVRWLKQEVVDAGTPPSDKNWRTLEYPLKDFAGTTVGIVVKVSYGGPKGVFNEEAFFDEISVVVP